MNLKNSCQTFLVHPVLLDRPRHTAGSVAGSSFWASHGIIPMAPATSVLQLHQIISWEEQKEVWTKAAPKSLSKTADSRATGAPAISLHQPPAAHWAAQWRTHPRVTWLGGRRDPFPWLCLQAWDYSGSNLSKCTHTYLNVGPDFTRLVIDIAAVFS